jgi:hypothetical protein
VAGRAQCCLNSLQCIQVACAQGTASVPHEDTTMEMMTHSNNTEHLPAHSPRCMHDNIVQGTWQPAWRTCRVIFRRDDAVCNMSSKHSVHWSLRPCTARFRRGLPSLNTSHVTPLHILILTL